MTEDDAYYVGEEHGARIAAGERSTAAQWREVEAAQAAWPDAYAMGFDTGRWPFRDDA